MFYVFLAYVFLAPLEYIVDKIPKGPTGINYGNLMMIAMTIWLIARRPNPGVAGPTRSTLNILLPCMLAFSYLGLMMTYMQFPQPELNPFNPDSNAFKRLLYLFNGYLYFWLAANMIDTRRRLRWTLAAILASAPVVFRSFYNSLSWFSGGGYRDALRVKGPFLYIGSNELGAYFVYGALFFLLLAFIRRRIWERFFLALGCSMYVYGVLYCYSRATQLSFLFAFALMAVLRYQVLLILFIGGYLTMDLWVPETVTQRWEMTHDEEGNLDDSAASRKIFWAYAREFYIQSPLVGHGWGSFILMNPAKMDTHSLYYRTLAEQGTVGIVLLMGIWAAVIRIGVDLWRRGTSPFERGYGFAIIIATSALMLTNYFGDRFTHLGMISQFWTFIGIGARLRAHAMGEEPLRDDVPLTPDEIPDRAGGGLADAELQPVAAPAPGPRRPFQPALRLLKPLLPAAASVRGPAPALNLVSSRVPASQPRIQRPPAAVVSPAPAARARHSSPAKPSLTIVGRSTPRTGAIRK